MTTQQEAKDMRDAIRQLEQTEEQQTRDQLGANMAIAETWWNTVKPAIPTTRLEALAAYQLIDGLLQTETDQFRIAVLKQKLKLANEEYKERKANG